MEQEKTYLGGAFSYATSHPGWGISCDMKDSDSDERRAVLLGKKRVDGQQVLDAISFKELLDELVDGFWTDSVHPSNLAISICFSLQNP